MTIRHVFDHYVKSLTRLYDKSEAENITHWIFEERLSLSKAGLLLRENDIISEVKANDLAWKLVRLLKGEPVQYVLGGTSFYGMQLHINKNVLIPRPETEELVDWIIKDNQTKGPVNILDIGTGSGCMAIALQKQLNQSTVSAIDISGEALAVASDNAQQLEAEILFKQVDFLSLMQDNEPEAAWPANRYHIICSNPPYIPESEQQQMPDNVVRFEPHIALFVPDHDPLVFYKAIAAFGAKWLMPEGFIYVEMHENMTDQVSAVFYQHGYQQLQVKTDMQGKRRMLKAGW
ncbi:MAG: peptide chain release factor N(5)-glutamine methyltransferase [Chitinophagales bacterium]|nr:peptide chain release factor N(5)-glutamine methyltransferase [Chitinophagales bacterium]